MRYAEAAKGVAMPMPSIGAAQVREQGASKPSAMARAEAERAAREQQAEARSGARPEGEDRVQLSAQARELAARDEAAGKAEEKGRQQQGEERAAAERRSDESRSAKRFETVA